MGIERPTDEKTMAEEIAHPERKRENKPPLGRHDSWSKVDHTDVKAVFSYIDEQRSKGTNPYRNICFNPDVEQYMEMIKKPKILWVVSATSGMKTIKQT